MATITRLLETWSLEMLHEVEMPTETRMLAGISQVEDALDDAVEDAWDEAVADIAPGTTRRADSGLSLHDGPSPRV